ncbi:glycosyltransferase [Marinovum sp.]|uniref:glycosyltransferase n=1 Tax=Marinovum sp. TaxID=2024839 RepID=UPI002B2672A0|nr:glycosyltransferase [Marinovum sp.]
MRIVHVVTRLLRAGSEENTLACCRWQAGAGHEVVLVHGAAADPQVMRACPAGVRLVALPELVHPIRPLADARALAALRRLYLRLRPDVIHTHQSKAGVLGRLAADVVPRARIIHGVHLLPWAHVSPLRRQMYLVAERSVAPRTDAFLAVSEALCTAYVSAGIAPRERLHCVRSGMDLARFRGAGPPRDWPALLRVPPGAPRPPVAVMLAALEPRKRHVAFLRAFAAVRRLMPEMRLLLAGAGPEEVRIRHEVARLGLSNRVTLCGHRADPEALLALADLSILTSEREGLPRVAVQSIAAGVPVLVNDLPGIGEVVRAGVNGSILPPRDAGAVAREMSRLSTDPQRLARLRQGAGASDLGAWALEWLGPETTALYGPAQTRAAA